MRFHRCSALRQTGQTISPFVGLASQASQTSQASQGFGCRGLGVRWPPLRWPGLTGGCIACNASNALWGALPPIPSPPEAFRRTGGHRTPGHRGGKDPYRQTPVRRSQSHRRGCGAPIQRLTKGLCLCGLLIALFLCFFKLTALMLPW